ncbi:MAG TPA: hypothetical protein VGN17_01915 [Bryobacteraceae bacterium]|jgi:hypothetical protein
MKLLKPLDFLRKAVRSFKARGRNGPDTPDDFTPLDRYRADDHARQLEVIYPPPDITLPLKRLREESHSLGATMGRESGRKDSHEPTLKVLDASATSLAEILYRSSFAQRERHNQAVIARANEELPRAAEAVDVAGANLRDRKNELASLPPRRPCPAISARLVGAATLGLTASMAPSLHDLIGMDPPLRWPIAILFAAGIAQLLVEGILPHGPSSPGKRWLRHGAFAGSLALAIAFLMIRLQGAGPDERAFAYGLSLAEASVALVLEVRGSLLQPLLDDWHREENARRRAEALTADAEDDLRSRKARVIEAERTIENRLDALEATNVVCDLPSLVSLAVSSARRGYAMAIAAHDVSVRGLARKETTRNGH